MWLRRTKSTSPFQHNLPPFSCSLKDIQSLFEEESNTNTNIFTNPISLNINVFNRVGSIKPPLLYPLKKPPRKNDNGNVLRRGVSEGSRCFLEETQGKGGLVEDNLVGQVGVLKRGVSQGFLEDEGALIEERLGEVDVKDGSDGVGFNVLRRGVSEESRLLLEDEGVLEQVEVKGGLVQDRLAGVVEVKDGSKGVGEIIELPGTETRVVIFFTSLRVVRNTFEDCKYVRTILHSFPVAIDERDLSMDMRFMKELQRIMGGDGEEKSCLRLPRVFIGGRYMGGAEEIRQLHETGELKKYLQGLALKPAGTCEECGGHGFVLCRECNGSHKCYVDKGGFKTCSECNENGLVRCSSCSSLPL